MDLSSDNLRAMVTTSSEADFDWEIGLAMDSDDEFLSALMVPLATSSPIRSSFASPAFTPQRLPYPSPLYVERLPDCQPLVLPPPSSLSPVPSCFSPGFLENYKLTSSCFSPEPEKHDFIELGSSPLCASPSPRGRCHRGGCRRGDLVTTAAMTRHVGEFDAALQFDQSFSGLHNRPFSGPPIFSKGMNIYTLLLITCFIVHVYDLK